MTQYRYWHLDVFTDRAFSGNQLAVFPDADGLRPEQMQNIATEMAFPETTFVLAPELPDTFARVRIFTPGRELPMAGHPTIGTVFALAREKRLNEGPKSVTLGLGVGPTRVSLEWSGETLEFAWMIQSIPVRGARPSNLSDLATALRVDESAIRESGLPVEEYSSGVPFLFVPLKSREDVNRVTVDRNALRAFFDDAGMSELPVVVFTLDTGEDDATTFSRMFAPVFGIQEDPATGGAAGPLGAYLLDNKAVTAQQAERMVNLQGAAMGRPSRIVISLTTSDGDIVETRVGGTAVIAGAGYLDV